MTESADADSPLSQLNEYGLDRPPQLEILSTTPSIASINANLDNAVREGRMTRFTIKGAVSGSEQECFMMYYVCRYSHQDRWGRQNRWLLPIGPAGASSPPVGQIIMGWTTTGLCTATLIAEGTVTVTSNWTVEELTAVLKDRFGISQVTGRDTEWKAADLRKVAAALLLMPEEDRPALTGVSLVRMLHVTNAEPNTDARFYVHQNIDPQSFEVTDVAEMQVGDGTFDSDDRVFVGTEKPRPFSCQRILHEAGHAVEFAACRRKFGAKLTAKRDLNRVATAVRASGKTVSAAQRTQYQEAKTRYDQAEAEMAATKTPAGRTIPAEAFVAYVTARKINRRLTGYAAENWQNDPEEFYAEAYSLWLLDPRFLARFSADLVRFFTDGTYRPAG
jgi:hypothetical protein